MTDDPATMAVPPTANRFGPDPPPPIRPRRPRDAASLRAGLDGVRDLVCWCGADRNAGHRVEVRDAVLLHMLDVGVLTEDVGVIAQGVKGEREFGRRHFSDLVAPFSSPLILTVFHGPVELGTVHPTSLARPPDGTAPALLLGGRNWEVVEVEWPRRRMSVAAADDGGRSRWLGTGRMLPYSICRAQERIVVGAEPACRLSRRATARLNDIRADMEFIDGDSLPLVSDGQGKITAWLFAGGLVPASLAYALSEASMTTAGWDDVSVTGRTGEIEMLCAALSEVDPATAHPALPADIAAALKFGLCLPAHVAEAVIVARTSKPNEVADAISRP